VYQIKKRIPDRVSSSLFRAPHGKGLEPIAVELSGGQFLQPVQTLVATLILPPGQNAHRVPSGVPTKKSLLSTRQKGLFSMISVPDGAGDISSI